MSFFGNLFGTKKGGINTDVDITHAVEHIKKTTKRTEQRLESKMVKWSERLKKDAISYAPKWSGHLRKNIHATVKWVAGRLIAKIESRAYYSPIVHDGLPGSPRVFVSFKNRGTQGRKLRRWAADHGFNVSKMKGLLVHRYPKTFMTDSLEQNLEAMISDFKSISK